MPDVPPTICILGPVLVDGKPLAGDIAPTVLVMLALANQHTVTTEALKRAWKKTPRGDNVVEKMISKIREHDLAIEKQRNGPYQLTIDRDQVDALRFIDGVHRLPPAPTPGTVDALLRLWRDDPRSYSSVAPEKWGTLLRARANLLQTIKGMEPAARDQLIQLSDFVSLFPLRENITAQAGLPGQKSRVTGRARVLIVEDQIADVFENALSDDYECVIIQSLDEWRALARGGDLDFAAAVVDMYLTDEGPEHGAEVLEDLRDKTRIPVLLASQRPRSGPVHQLTEQYWLAGVYNKGPKDSLPQLRQEVARIIREGRPPRSRRLRFR